MKKKEEKKTKLWEFWSPQINSDKPMHTSECSESTAKLIQKALQETHHVVVTYA